MFITSFHKSDLSMSGTEPGKQRRFPGFVLLFCARRLQITDTRGLLRWAKRIEGVATLTALEKAFAREYVLDHNGTRAAIRAGYAPGKDNANAAARASRLLKKQAVLDEIAKHEAEAAKEFVLTRDGVINRYREIYERCMDAKPVMAWDSIQHKYVPTGVWQFDARGAMKALGSIAVMAGLGKPEKPDSDDGYESLLAALEEDSKREKREKSDGMAGAV